MSAQAETRPATATPMNAALIGGLGMEALSIFRVVDAHLNSAKHSGDFMTARKLADIKLQMAIWAVNSNSHPAHDSFSALAAILLQADGIVACSTQPHTVESQYHVHVTH
jgi:hypothetical protein